MSPAAVASLPQNNLAGSLPAKWTLPASLTVLNISSNGLSGTIPASLRLPAGLQELHMCAGRSMP